MSRRSVVHLLLLGWAAAAVLVPLGHAADANKQTYLDRGIAEKNNNDFDAAIADFGRAIALDPKWASAYEFRGATLVDKFESSADPSIGFDAIDKAIADYDTVIRLGAATTRTYTLRGIALSDEEDYKAAITDLDHAVALDPSFPLAARSREAAVAGLREQDRAIALDGELLRFQPRNLELLLSRAALLTHEQRRDEALWDLDTALKIDPGNEEALAQRDALIGSEHKPADKSQTPPAGP